jgi:sugar phosphate isomerase/epimerase
MADSLREILNHAAKEPQIRVGVEYEPGFLIGSATNLHTILQTVDHPLLGVNLDIGHSVCVGEALPLVIKSFAGRIWNLHVEDIMGQIHEHLIPGKGQIDFEEVRTSLDEIGYDEFLTLEIYPYKDRPGEAGTESLEFLRKVFGAR